MAAAAAARRAPRRKRFGQHFLHDPAAIARIVRALAPRPGDHLVEIGPGRGALTRRLLECADCTLDAIEIDRDLAAQLASAFAGSAQRALHVGDALEFDYRGLALQRAGRLRIVGNLPYNISTPLLFRLLAQADAIVDLHVMLQREVVARLAARPGEPGYGRLGVMLAPWMSCERLFELGPGAFQPAPRVWSAVVRLRVRDAPLFAVSPHYAAVVAAAFSHRRKTLRNALTRLLGREQIAACGLDPGTRPEQLTPQQFNTLAQTLDRARV
ncbi:MAG TPA: 16S rRNA (adenine(1518)-N(6)/adenine(1519)-N(6))-dimethyltransferase RsmA [Steroidobacteraceae bacterium]|jgi:16S rRNA (adenine1518-N6/adenine1519-N6)-dimethyltransferase|nr:16S rRNA (adenine(1518)-N(6)/adenine(1519)-N(6))-dimethyltransferase RsmA [Steroidobacteraceae bacterium]